MSSLPESLASWATLLGTILTAVGLIQSRAWLVALSATFAMVALGFGLYSARERAAMDKACVNIAGRSIDALNAANLRRRVNRTLVVQQAEQVAKIDGTVLKMTWRYTGYCRAARETAFEFSVDAENPVPLEQLDCYAYDLRQDPQQKQPIRPMLLGPDGVSKKLAVPFLQPLASQEPFDIVITCKLNRCFSGRLGYYTSSLSFDQAYIRSSTVRLVFNREIPVWVRAYDCGQPGGPKLLNELRISQQTPTTTEYVHGQPMLPGRSAITYVFYRPGFDKASDCALV